MGMTVWLFRMTVWLFRICVLISTMFTNQHRKRTHAFAVEFDCAERENVLCIQLNW